jgi:hypothetical protein
VENYIVQKCLAFGIKTMPVIGEPVPDKDMLPGIHGNLPGLLQGIGNSPTGHDSVPLKGLKRHGRGIGFFIIDHKEEFTVGIVPEDFAPVAVGNIKKPVPHGQIGMPQAPVTLNVIQGNLILQAAYIKGKEILPVHLGDPLVPPAAKNKDDKGQGCK